MLVDVAVSVVEVTGLLFGGEPVLGAGGVLGWWSGGVAIGEFELGAVGVGPGEGGVHEIVGIDVVGLSELGDLGIEQVRQRGRFRGFLQQSAPGIGVGGGVGVGRAQGRG